MQVTKRVATLLLAVLLLCTSTVFPIWGYALDTGQETTVTEVTTTTDAEDATEAPTAEATTEATNATEKLTEATEASTEETTEPTEATTEPATDETTGATTDATEETTEPETEDITEVTNTPVITDNAETIWNYLYDYFGNACAAAGVMGNMWAESGLDPTNMENAYEGTYTDETYTAAIDSGEYTEEQFTSDGIGYGLVQWTYSEYKQSLYEYAQEQKTSIGSLTMQLDFLLEQMDTIKTTMRDNLMAATTVSQASNLFLIGMENESADDETKQERAGYGSFYYSYGQSLIAAATEPTTDETEPETEAAAEATDPSAVTECNPTELTATLDDGSTVSLYSPATVINGKATLTAATFEPDDEYMEVLLESFGIENVLGYECIELTLSPSLSLVTVTLTFPEDLVPSLNDTDTCHVLVEMDDEVSAADAEFTATNNSLVKATFELESMSESVRLYVLTSDEASAAGSSSSGTTTPDKGGTSTGDGKGVYSNAWAGVTLQVVYYRYADCYNKQNSYNCIINTIKNPDNTALEWEDGGSYTGTAGKLTTVYNGKVYNSSNTVMLWAHSATDKIQMLNGKTIPSQLDGFLNRIVTGSGTWNKKSVGESDSDYTALLEFLGTPTKAIENYLASFNGELDPTDEDDGNLLIPTVIWAFMCGESTGGLYTIYVMNDLVGQMYSNDVGSAAWDKNWSKAEYVSHASKCAWQNDYWYNKGSRSYVCRFCLGPHKYKWDGSELCTCLDYVSRLDGLGLVNYVQGDGVDSTSGNGYYFRGYWTPFDETTTTVVKKSFTLTKTSASTSALGLAVSGNSNYSLSGAVYGVYSNSSCTSLIEKLTTDSSGKATSSSKYSVGTTYYIKEITAPTGYNLDTTVHSLKITSGTNTITVSDTPITKTFTLTKTSSASAECQAQISGNSLYSLSGAKYGVYSTKAKATAGGTPDYETLTTNSSGKATSSKSYTLGTTVYIRELTAPAGYKLNSTVYSLTISSTDSANTVPVADEPVFDPPFALTKVDEDTTTPQGNTNFSGAVFKWEYFANDSWSGTATRTWYFMTDASGYAIYDEAYLADDYTDYTSDKLYTDTNGDYGLPLGTVRITEIENSLGYTVLSSSLEYSIVQDNSTEVGATQIPTSATLTLLKSIATGNYGVYEAQNFVGCVTVQKVDSENTTAQGSATLEGAVFEIINNSTNSVKIDGFDEAEPGEVCMTITTVYDADKDACVATSGEVLPIGKYTIRESTTGASTGYLANTEWSQTFEVTETDTTFDYTTGDDSCSEDVIRGGLKIIKQNDLDGESTGSDAMLDGIRFAIITENDNPVLVNDVSYSKGETVMTLTIAWNESEQAWTASTEDDALPYGTYTVKELAMSDEHEDLANYYYLLNTEAQTLTVTEDGTIYEQTFQNALRPGEITITKVNATNETLSGATFKLQWRQYDTDEWTTVTKADLTKKGGCTSAELSDDGTLTTDDTGVITFEGLDPRMQYRVTELEAPEGYQLLSDFAYTGLLEVDTASIDLTVVNNHPYILPSTGSNSLLLLPLLAAPLYAMAFAMVYALTTRRKRR